MAYFTHAFAVASLVVRQLPLVLVFLQVRKRSRALLSGPVAVPIFGPFLGNRVMVELFNLRSLSLLQHDLLEFVNDKVLADASDAILAVLLGVDAHDAGGRLDLVLVDFLLLKDVFGQELEQ